MSVASDMVKAYPTEINLDRELLARCVDACIACAQACTACADACLSEEMTDELRKCIRTDLDCADICEVTGRVLSPHTGYDANLTERSCRPVSRRARAVAMSASVTPRCTSTAESAPRPAGVPSRPARTCSPPSAERRSQHRSRFGAPRAFV
jgi:hypothetical protein